MCCVLNLNTVTLWAMWQQAIPTTMQGFGDYCKNMVQDNGNNGDSIYLTLTDTRDNNQYKVAKLKDGKCWMIQNLRLGGNNKTNTLSSLDSDVASSYTLPNSNASNFNDGNPIAAIFVVNANTEVRYSWIAATAGSTITTGNAPYSICPRGWRLPTTDEHVRIASVYGNDFQQLKRAPVPNFVNETGYCEDRQCVNHSLWQWSSTSTNGQDASGIFYNGASIYPQCGYASGCGLHKGMGLPIRCISRI